MTLFLLEANNLDFASTKEELEAKAASLSTKTIPTLIEVQATENLTHGYFIVEANDEAEAKQFLTKAGISIQLVKEVRLVGKDLDEVKNGDAHVDYLVTWNIPEGITMDRYLARKKKILFIMKKYRKLNLNAHMYVKICLNVFVYTTHLMKKRYVARAKQLIHRLMASKNFNKTTS